MPVVALLRIPEAIVLREAEGQKGSKRSQLRQAWGTQTSARSGPWLLQSLEYLGNSLSSVQGVLRVTNGCRFFWGKAQRHYDSLHLLWFVSFVPHKDLASPSVGGQGGGHRSMASSDLEMEQRTVTSLWGGFP